MFLKAAFKNAPVFVQLLMLLAVVTFCTFLFQILISMFVITKTGISQDTIHEVLQNLYDYPEIMRGLLFLQMLGLFLLPAIICAWFFSDNYKEYLGIDKPVHSQAAFWTILSLFAALPFLNLTLYLNQQMVFPDALSGFETKMKEWEEAANKATELLLDTKIIPEIIFNFLVVCVITAVCEEFMFRGLLQNLLGRMIRNPHLLIWTIAVIFSAFHLQFYGFIPRMLLGAWLGYLMFYTKTIWIPALAHFVNNFFAVGTYYMFQNTPDEINKIDALGTGSTLWLSFASIILFFFCFFKTKKATVQ